jgi:beta-mannosidase
MYSRLSLNGIWDLVGFEPDQGDWPSVELPYPVKADVPGTVLPALVKAGVVDEKLFIAHPQRFNWIDEKEWCYRRTFELPDGFERTRSYMELDGLGASARVMLNGKAIEKTADALVSNRFDVTGKLRAEGENMVEVRFAPPDRTSSQEMRHGHNDAGIRRGAEVVSCDKLSIRNVRIQNDVELHAAEAWISVEIENHIGEETDAFVTVVVARGESREKMDIRESIPADGGVVEAVVRILEPELWWPNGMGEQPIYVALVGLQADGEIQDVREERFGLRTVELLDNAGGATFELLINGTPIKVSGADWSPASRFALQGSEDDYRDALIKARDDGYNLLRVRGDGVCEDDVFCRMCDELGIMVWQDLMSARDGRCAIEELRSEVTRIITALRNHPSIVLWCGCEEGKGEWLFDEDIASIVRRQDGSRPYRSSIPEPEAVLNRPPIGIASHS